MSAVICRSIFPVSILNSAAALVGGSGLQREFHIRCFQITISLFRVLGLILISRICIFGIKLGFRNEVFHTFCKRVDLFASNLFVSLS